MDRIATCFSLAIYIVGSRRGSVRRLEKQEQLAFQRGHAAIKSSLTGADPAIAAWVSALWGVRRRAL